MRSRASRKSFAFVMTVAMAVCAAPACLLTTSLDGFSDGSSGGNVDGDGATGEGAVGSETGGDSGADSAAIDGRADAGGDADARAGFRCTDRPDVAYCSDFETDPFYFGWHEAKTDLGGLLAFAPAKTSRGLKATLPDHSNKPRAFLVRDLLLPAGTSFTYSFDMLAPANTSSGVVSLPGFFFRGAYYEAFLRSYQTGEYYVQEYADPKAPLSLLARGTKLARGPMPNVWTHVEMRVSFTTSSSTIRVKLDSDVVLDAPIEAWNYIAMPTSIALGMPSTDSAGTTISIVFDDVIVTTP